MTDAERKTAAMVCTKESFRPCCEAEVRWLDWEADFDMARELWAGHGFELSKEEWLSFRDVGYTYCAIVENDRIVSRAAVFTRTETEWEAAAVWTSEAHRGRGYAKSVVSFVTQSILDSGRLATCHTGAGNAAMIGAALSVGFVIRD